MTIVGSEVYEHSYAEFIRIIVHEAQIVNVYGSLERQRDVLEYISREKLKPKSLLSCEYALILDVLKTA